MSAFPPQLSQPSVPVSSTQALALLSAYLDASANASSAYLLPNATLQASGPVAPGGGLSVHNLRRVEAGLRGEWLAPELELGEEEETVEAGEGMEGVVDGEAAEGWQDLAEYQREQSLEEGDGEATGVVAVEEIPLKVEVGDAVLETERKTQTKVLDKEARKAEKKLRLKNERKEKGRKKAEAST